MDLAIDKLSTNLASNTTVAVADLGWKVTNATIDTNAGVVLVTITTVGSSA